MASVAKVITIIGSSPESFAKAADAAVQEAAKTVRGITGADVISMSAEVEGERITQYRTTVNIAFAIERYFLWRGCPGLDLVVAACRACGAANAENASFCHACGGSLGASVAVAQSEVRKTVTVLFADVAGFTELGEQLDPENLRTVMSRYFEEMRRILEGHGGTVEKFIGDAVMAVFGVPVSHEDDALRAVRAADEMLERVQTLNQELGQRYATPLELRIGINTGPVVAGNAASGETLVTGDAVNLAKRLEQAAPSGTILIGKA